MGGISGGSNKQSSSSSSKGEQFDFGTNVWGPQQQYLQNNWAAAQGLANGPMGGMDQFNQSQGALGQGMAGLQQSNQNLQSFQNPTVDPAFGAYGNRLQQDFTQKFLPQLQGQAIQAGGLGGSRQQIGAGMGAQAAGQAMSDFAANSYAGQQQRALQAAGLQGQNAQGFGQFGQQYLGNADFSRGMPWYNQNMFSGLLGGPAMQDLGGYGWNKSKMQSKGSGWNADLSVAQQK